MQGKLEKNLSSSKIKKQWQDYFFFKDEKQTRILRVGLLCDSFTNG
jgi:hypothetical protein